MIYLDNAATTPMNERVQKAMLPYLREAYGNPAGIYGLGVKSRNAIEEAREQIAKTLDCKAQEIYFTAGGSESDNWMLQRMTETCEHPHIITSKIEHHAVINTCRYLEKKGVRVTYLDVDEMGIVNTDQLQNAITPDTCLISIMTANNEVGAIQPMKKIGAIAKKHGILFHTDAVQAYGHIPIALQEWNVAALSASAHKFCGPKGCGFLFLREDVLLPPLLYGGSQEKNKRAGTSNVAGIVGMGEAATWAYETMEARTKKESQMRDWLIREVQKNIPYTRVNGSMKNRLPNNISFSFPFVEGETLLQLLDMEEICASAASACASESHEISHVLRALGLPESLARGTIRLTLSAQNTQAELERVVEVLEESVARIREMTQEYNDFLNPGYKDKF